MGTEKQVVLVEIIISNNFGNGEQGGPKETPAGMTGVSGQETVPKESELERPKPFSEDSRGKLEYQWNQERELLEK